MNNFLLPNTRVLEFIKLSRPSVPVLFAKNDLSPNYTMLILPVKKSSFRIYWFFGMLQYP